MTVQKYLTSALKIIIFVFLCVSVRIFTHNVLPLGVDSAVSAAFSVLFTVLFVIGVEEKKRKLIVPMNGVDGMTFTGIIGIATVALPVVIEIILGNVEINDMSPGFDLLMVLYCGCEGIFAAMLAYGYVFIIMKEDFGLVAAGIVSSLLGLFYMDIFIYDFLPDPSVINFDSFAGALTVDPDTVARNSVIMIINIVLFVAVAFFLTYRYGDIRPITIFMFLHFASASMLPMLLIRSDKTAFLSGMEIYSGLTLSIPMAGLIVFLIFMI